ncbi:MAG: Lrp/AsnC family transcriptional regulator [Candidatus Hermodarchaeota archaeon]
MKDGQLEDLDFEILEVLFRDGRKAYKNIADELGKNHLTIKKHMDELEEAKIIKNYSINIDYEQMDLNIIALIEITIDKGKMIEVEKDIAKNPNIFGVYDVTGEYDAIILARFKTRQELSELVKKINSYEYVIRTNTHLILNIIKEGTDFARLFKNKIKKTNE